MANITNRNVRGMIKQLVDRGCLIVSHAGAPTSGTSGTYVNIAGPGSVLLDYTNGQAYINTNTLASPTWSKIPDAAGDISLTTGSTLIGVAGVAAALDVKGDGKITVGNGTTATSVAVSGDATLANTGALTVAAGAITLAKVSPATLDGTVNKVVANVNVIGGIPVIHRITCAALTGDVDVVLTHKTRITEVWAVGTAAAGAGDTVQVKNGANAITNALDMNVADTTIVRAGTLDDAQWDVAAAGTLRITGASAVNAEVFVLGIRVA